MSQLMYGFGLCKGSILLFIITGDYDLQPFWLCHLLLISFQKYKVVIHRVLAGFHNSNSKYLTNALLSTTLAVGCWFLFVELSSIKDVSTLLCSS